MAEGKESIGGVAGADPPIQDKPPGKGLFTIEELAAREGVKAAEFAAVMQAEKWAPGKKVTVAAFKGALAAFLRGPMGGKR
jgi:hypothetical protein